MSRASVILSDSSEKNSETTLCRLCMKNNDSYYNIFTSTVACELTVKDGLHDLVGLQVALGDGLPATVCPLCLKKLMELSDFKRICFESDAELRKCSSRYYFNIIKEEKAAEGNVESSADTKGCVQDTIEGTSQFACSVQTTEIYIPVQDCQSPGANIMCNVKEENERFLSEGNYPAFNSPNTAGISSEALDPLATDDLPRLTKDEKPIYDLKMTNDSTMEAPGLSASDKVLVETTSTSYLLGERNVRIDLSDDCGAPSVSVMQIQSKTVASHVGDGMNVTDKDLEEGSDLHTGKIMSNPIPDDGQSYLEHITASKNSGNGATMTVVGGKGDAPHNIDSLRLIRIGENRSSKKLNYCSHCRYGFSTTDDLIKHIEIHSGSSNLDLNDESSMGKDESITILGSSEESSNSCESSTSETLIGLRRKSQGPMQKENTPVIKISVGLGEEKTVGRVRSSGGDGKANTQNMSSESTSCAGNLQNHTLGVTKGGPFNCSVCNKSFTLSSSLSNHMRTHKERKHPCGICGKSFARKYHLTQHMYIHSGEKPYSCRICCKSFVQSTHLTSHMRTHSGEKVYSCNFCAKSFAESGNLNTHMLTHTGEKPHSCNYCAKSFSHKSNLNKHLRTHV